MYHNEIILVGNHTLNTRSVLDLSVSLAERFDINVEYGFNAEEIYSKWLGTPDLEVGLNVLDSIHHNPSAITCYVFDDYYQNKQLHQRFGDAIFQRKNYWFFHKNYHIEPQMITDEKRIIYSETYKVVCDDLMDFPLLTIHQDYFKLQTPYASNWKKFCQVFRKETISDDLIQLRNYLFAFLSKMGGTNLYLFQGDSILEQVADGGKAHGMDWESVELIINTLTGNSPVSIASFLNDEIANHQIRHATTEPLVFSDDFSDFR